MANIFSSLARKAWRKAKRAVKYILEDSRNMGRLSSVLLVASFGLAFVSPPLFGLALIGSSALFAASVFSRARIERRERELSILTDDKKHGIFKGISLGKLQVMHSKLAELGITINPEKLNNSGILRNGGTTEDAIEIDSARLELLDIKPKHISLEAELSEGNPPRLFLNFRTHAKLRARARITDDEPSDMDNSSSTSENNEVQQNAQLIFQLQEKLGVLQDQFKAFSADTSASQKVQNALDQKNEQNKELLRSNEELQARIEELDRSNSDLREKLDALKGANRNFKAKGVQTETPQLSRVEALRRRKVAFSNGSDTSFSGLFYPSVARSVPTGSEGPPVARSVPTGSEVPQRASSNNPNYRSPSFRT